VPTVEEYSQSNINRDLKEDYVIEENCYGEEEHSKDDIIVVKLES